MTFGGGIALDKYNGERTLSSLIEFVSKQSGHEDDNVKSNTATGSEEQKKNKVILLSFSSYASFFSHSSSISISITIFNTVQN